jgi:cob(I)alamin adenosyltransferase
MVKLNKIYTRTGDAGETGLGDGTRVPKHDARVSAYGDVDEANAAIGVAIAALGEAVGQKAVCDLLRTVQNDLFDLGADLCIPESDAADTGDSPQALRITHAQVTSLETAIDQFNAHLAPLTSFVLPGGSAAAAHLHHARAIVRRAERSMTALAVSEKVNSNAIAYINRLSDLLFVLARCANDDGATDALWVPGGQT